MFYADSAVYFLVFSDGMVLETMPYGGNDSPRTPSGQAKWPDSSRRPNPALRLKRGRAWEQDRRQDMLERWRRVAGNGPASSGAGRGGGNAGADSVAPCPCVASVQRGGSGSVARHRPRCCPSAPHGQPAPGARVPPRRSGRRRTPSAPPGRIPVRSPCSQDAPALAPRTAPRP